MSAIAAAEQLFKRKKERKKKKILKKKKRERRNRIRTLGSEIAARRVTDYSTEKLAEAGEIYAYIAFPLVSHCLIFLFGFYCVSQITLSLLNAVPSCALLFLRDVFSFGCFQSL